MRKLFLLLSLPILLTMTNCKPSENGDKKADVSPITKESITKVTNELVGKYGDSQKFRIERGVSQVALLWRNSDGTQAEFEEFCNAIVTGKQIGRAHV